MKKTYCDICGKEIVKSNETWNYGLNASKGNSRVGFNENIEEVCEKCATIIHCCVSMMKEVGWEPAFREKLESTNAYESDRAGYVLLDLEG